MINIPLIFKNAGNEVDGSISKLILFQENSLFHYDKVDDLVYDSCCYVVQGWNEGQRNYLLDQHFNDVQLSEDIIISLYYGLDQIQQKISFAYGEGLLQKNRNN